MTPITIMRNKLKRTGLAGAFVLGFLGSLAFADAGNDELLANGNFQTGQAPWVLENNGGASSTCTIVNEAPGGKPAAAIAVPATNTGELWLVSFKQEPLPIVQGKSYQVTFQMKASDAKLTCVSVKQGVSPWGKIPGFDGKALHVTTEWQDFSFEYKAEGNEPEARFYFTNLNQPGVTWYLANLSFKELPAK